MSNFIGELREVLERADDLPTLPVIVLELHAALDDEFARDHEIAAIINRDPALATRLLRLANSAAFNVGTPVADVAGAIQLLGTNQLRVVSLAVAVVNAFSSKRGGLGHRTFWYHSAAVATATRALARCLNYRHIPLETLYVGGLLHDIGLLVMDQYFPDMMQRSLAKAVTGDDPLWKVEHDVLGTDHGEIGGFLLGRWSLPETIIAMVGSHHHPNQGPAEHRDAAWLVYAAELLCGGFGPSLQVERITEAQASGILAAMQSEEYDAEHLLAELDVAAQEVAAVLT